MNVDLRREPNTTVMVCPFCARDMCSYETGAWVSVYDYKRQEEMVVAHLRAHHPIRWRLNREMRRAIRGSVGMHIAGSGPVA